MQMKFGLSLIALYQVFALSRNVYILKWQYDGSLQLMLRNLLANVPVVVEYISAGIKYLGLQTDINGCKKISWSYSMHV